MPRSQAADPYADPYRGFACCGFACLTAHELSRTLPLDEEGRLKSLKPPKTRRTPESCSRSSPEFQLTAYSLAKLHALGMGRFI